MFQAIKRYSLLLIVLVFIAFLIEIIFISLTRQCLLCFIQEISLTHTLISGIEKLYQTPDISSAPSRRDPNLICTSLSFMFINPSVFPVTFRTFSSHQVELSMTTPHPFSSKETSPCLLKFWHELEGVDSWYSGVSIYMFVLHRYWRFKSKHPTGTVTENLMAIVSPSFKP